MKGVKEEMMYEEEKQTSHISTSSYTLPRPPLAKTHPHARTRHPFLPHRPPRGGAAAPPIPSAPTHSFAVQSPLIHPRHPPPCPLRPALRCQRPSRAPACPSAARSGRSGRRTWRRRRPRAGCERGGPCVPAWQERSGRAGWAGGRRKEGGSLPSGFHSKADISQIVCSSGQAEGERERVPPPRGAWRFACGEEAGRTQWFPLPQYIHIHGRPYSSTSCSA